MSVGKFVAKTIEAVGVVTKVGIEMGADALGYIAEKADDQSGAKEKIREKGKNIGSNIKRKTSEFGETSAKSVDGLFTKVAEGTDKVFTNIKNKANDNSRYDEDYRPRDERKYYRRDEIVEAEYNVEKTMIMTTPLQVNGEDTNEESYQDKTEPLSNSKYEGEKTAELYDLSQLAQLAGRKGFDSSSSNIINKIGEISYSKLPPNSQWYESLEDMLLEIEEREHDYEVYSVLLQGELIFNYENYNENIKVIQGWLDDKKCPSLQELDVIFERIKAKNGIMYDNGLKHTNGTPLSFQGQEIIKSYQRMNCDLSTLIEKLKKDYKFSYTRFVIMELFLENFVSNTELIEELYDYDSREVTKAIINSIDFYSNKKLDS